MLGLSMHASEVAAYETGLTARVFDTRQQYLLLTLMELVCCDADWAVSHSVLLLGRHAAASVDHYPGSHHQVLPGLLFLHIAVCLHSSDNSEASPSGPNVKLSHWCLVAGQEASSGLLSLKLAAQTNPWPAWRKGTPHHRPAAAPWGCLQWRPRRAGPTSWPSCSRSAQSTLTSGRSESCLQVSNLKLIQSHMLELPAWHGNRGIYAPFECYLGLLVFLLSLWTTPLCVVGGLPGHMNRIYAFPMLSATIHMVLGIM